MVLNLHTLLIGVAVFIVAESIRGWLKAKDKKKYLIKEVLVGVPIIACLFLFGPLILLSPIKPGFSSLSNDKVTVYFPKSQPDKGRELLEISQRSVETVEGFYRVPVKTKVLLASSKLNSFRLTGNPVAGGTGSSAGVIALFVLTRLTRE